MIYHTIEDLHRAEERHRKRRGRAIQKQPLTPEEIQNFADSNWDIRTWVK